MRTKKFHLPRSRFLRALLGDTRGAVFAESVIMIPFFLIILGSVTYVHDSYRARIVVFQQTKGCAWDYANRGCTGTAACQVTDQGAFGGGEVMATIQRVPVIGTLLDQLFGRRVKYNKSINVARPSFLGGGTQAVRGEQVLACNTQPRNILQLMRDMLSSIWNGGSGNLSGLSGS